MRTLRWLLKPLRRHATERDMDDEMRLHIAMEAEELMRTGVDTVEAQREARARFGGAERHKDEARDAWPFRWLANVVADVRYALRSLRHAPSFTLTAVAALALGIGANATVFGAVDSMAFRPLAVEKPEQLVAMYGTQGQANLLNFTWDSYQEFRRDARAFTDIAAVTEGPVAVLNGDDASAVWAAHVSDNYFTMLGVKPHLGMPLHAGDFEAPVAMVSHACWTTMLAGDPGIVGKSIRVNGSAFTVVGVVPKSFTGTRLFTYEPCVWLPIGMHAQTIPSSTSLLTPQGSARFLLLGRLREGVTLSQARAIVDGVAEHIAASNPDAYRGLHTQLISNRTPINPWLVPAEQLTGIGQLSLFGVTLVLLIACADVANLLLARMTARRQEIAIRLSLGASRARLAQQFITESLVLSLLGALAAIPVTVLAFRGIDAMAPRLDYASSYRPVADARVAAYAALLAIGSALVFGLAPALQAVRSSVGAGLRARTPGTQRWRLHFRELLVIAQVALSVVVLAAAGLFYRSLQAVRTIDPGFAIDGAVSFTLDPQLSPTYDAIQSRALYRRVESSMASMPGVRAVGRASWVPLDGSSASDRVFPEGTGTPIERAKVAETNISAPGYFEAIGTRMIEGRDFMVADTARAVDAVIVNEMLARTLWPGQPTIGKQLRVGSPAGALVEVIGVVASSKYRSVNEQPRLALWRNLDRSGRSRTTVIVRGVGDGPGAIAAVRAALHDIDPSLPVIGLSSLRDHVSVSYTAVASGAAGAMEFGMLAMILAVSGIYGVVAYGASQRKREIGIRMALGAGLGPVVRLVVKRALVMTLIGIATGLAVVAVVPMGMDRMLYGVTPRDPFTLGAVAIVFCAIACIAALLPARRAAALEPMRALRLAVFVIMAGIGLSAPALGGQAPSPMDLGRAAYRKGDSEEAIKWFSQAVDAMPDSMSAHLWLGRAYTQQLPKAGFLKQPIIASHARTQFDKAVALEPNNVEPREDRAIYYMYAPGLSGGGADKARAEAEVARTLNPFRGALLRARIEDHEKQPAAAEAEYVALLKSYPDSAAPFNGILGLLQAAKRYVEAWAVIDARVAVAPTDLWAVYQTGRTAALSGERLERGEAALRSYLKTGKFFATATEANAHHRLGMILEQRGDAKGARQEYEAAVKLDPGLADARKGLERVTKASH